MSKNLKDKMILTKDEYIKSLEQELKNNKINLWSEIQKSEKYKKELAEINEKIFKYFSFRSRVEKYQGLTESGWKEYKELIKYFEALCGDKQ